MSEPSAADLRIGRTMAWANAVASILGVIALFAVPMIGQGIALFTWTYEEQAACKASPEPCAISIFPEDSAPVWVGIAWVALILISLIVCWSPRRWWTPQGRTSPSRPGVFSTPEWFRLHAFVALVFNAAAMFGVGRGNSFRHWEFAWPTAGAAAAIALATICIAVTAAVIPPSVREGLGRGYSFWLFAPELRRRAAADRDAGVATDPAPDRAGPSPRRDHRRRTSSDG